MYVSNISNKSEAPISKASPWKVLFHSGDARIDLPFVFLDFSVTPLSGIAVFLAFTIEVVVIFAGATATGSDIC